MTYADEVHPAFIEAARLREGVAMIADGDGSERARMMIALTGDDTGSIASGLIALYHSQPNRMELITTAFLAGLLIGRDSR